MAHLDLDLDTDIDMDVDVVGSAWGSRPGGQWHHSYDSCGPTTIRAWFFLLHLLNPPAPVAHLDMDVDVDVDVDIDIDADMDVVGSAWGSPSAPAVVGGTTAMTVGQQYAPGSF